jgi:hypothetical protein
MNYNVKSIRSPHQDRDWYEVSNSDNQFHLWIVEHDLLIDTMSCTCEEPVKCDHRSAVLTEIAEATRMAAQIAELCERQAWERFMLYRMAETSMETLRKFHAELTAPAIAAAEALEADYREDAADRLDYARGQF